MYTFTKLPLSLFYTLGTHSAIVHSASQSQSTSLPFNTGFYCIVQTHAVLVLNTLDHFVSCENSTNCIPFTCNHFVLH